MRELKLVFVWIGIVVCLILLGLGGWKLDRWINWKFDYGRRGNARDEKLEGRVDALEKVAQFRRDAADE